MLMINTIVMYYGVEITCKIKTSDKNTESQIIAMYDNE